MDISLKIDFTTKTYRKDECCAFRKVKGPFGGLSNMAGGFPLVVNDIKIRSTEALYQVCRFPNFPEIQEEIILQKSPMFAKFVSKSYKNQSRKDWDDIQVEIMYWALRLKLAQNLLTFGNLLKSTTDKNIVEHSRNNEFWGTISDKGDDSILIGANVLGQLLELLRDDFQPTIHGRVIVIPPPDIPDLFLYGKKIQDVVVYNDRD
jgi:ribA/ribD-fused uncharacterized protein